MTETNFPVSLEEGVELFHNEMIPRLIIASLSVLPVVYRVRYLTGSGDDRKR